MRDNINKVSQRGERLDHLQDKTDNLAVSAQGFRRGANRVRKAMWWKDMKMRMWIAIGVVILLVIIIVPSGRSLPFLSRGPWCQEPRPDTNVIKQSSRRRKIEQYLTKLDNTHFPFFPARPSFGYPSFHVPSRPSRKVHDDYVRHLPSLASSTNSTFPHRPQSFSKGIRKPANETGKGGRRNGVGEGNMLESRLFIIPT